MPLLFSWERYHFFCELSSGFRVKEKGYILYKTSKFLITIGLELIFPVIFGIIYLSVVCQKQTDSVRI